MCKKIQFSDEQLQQMVELHNEGLLNREIADIFSVSKGTINRRLNDMGVKSRHPRLTLEREQWICELYKKYHNKEIVQKIANTSGQTINELCNKYNLHNYTNSELHRKYTINENYFDEINTSNKAYFLGLLFSDGTITSLEKHVMQISLQERDKSILEKMLKDMDSNYRLYFKNLNDKNSNYQNQYYISINNLKICEGLYKHGMHKNKSLTIEYPTDMANEYNKDFIRGLLDGDGYISKTGHHVSIVGTKMIISRIKEIIENNLSINSSICDCRNNNMTKELKIYGRKQAYSFLSWVYDDAEMYIDRKYNVYVSEYKNKVA